MPNIMGVLRAEIRRLARKETKQELTSLKKQVTAMRHRLADSRQRLQQLEQSTKRVTPIAAMAMARSAAARGGEEEAQVRFSPAWVRSHRKKLAMSRLVYARLVGVSPQTIMGWEAGRTRPRRQALRTWRALRARGIRELRAMVSGEGTGERATRKVARRRVARKVARRRAVRKVVRRRVVRKVVRRRVARKVVRRRVARTRTARRRTVAGRRIRARGAAKKK